MAVSNDKYYKPEEALQELRLQQTIFDVAVDIQSNYHQRRSDKIS